MYASVSLGLSLGAGVGLDLVMDPGVSLDLSLERRRERRRSREPEPERRRVSSRRRPESMVLRAWPRAPVSSSVNVSLSVGGAVGVAVCLSTGEIGRASCRERV